MDRLLEKQNVAQERGAYDAYTFDAATQSMQARGFYAEPSVNAPFEYNPDLFSQNGVGAQRVAAPEYAPANDRYFGSETTQDAPASEYYYTTPAYTAPAVEQSFAAEPARQIYAQPAETVRSEYIGQTQYVPQYQNEVFHTQTAKPRRKMSVRNKMAVAVYCLIMLAAMTLLLINIAGANTQAIAEQTEQAQYDKSAMNYIVDENGASVPMQDKAPVIAAEEQHQTNWFDSMCDKFSDLLK